MASELEHRSFRLPHRLLTRLRSAAAERRTSQTALVERYLEEGLRMDEYASIVFRNSRFGRRAMLEGSRLEIAQVVETARNESGAVEGAAQYLGLSVAQVRACIRYYADHRDEIDRYAVLVQAENERLREAWERERELLSG